MDSLAIEYSNSFGAELNSFYQLNDIAASGSDNQALVLSNDVWVAQPAIPYVIASGTYTHPTAVVSLAVNGGLKLTTILYESVNGGTTPFTQPPIVTVTQVSLPGGSGIIIPKIDIGNNITSFDLYIYNAGSVATNIAADTLRINWIAIQMASDLGSGATSTDPTNV
jgi:hypothetical protein